MSAPDGFAGAAADAIRDAEASLVRQKSVVAQVDLQVVTAVLNAHTVHGAGAAALEGLQREIEHAVVSRPDLDTPAGARSFQRYLIDKVRDIRAVVDGTSLDDTSKATLAAALGSLYASADPAAGSAEADAAAGSAEADLGDLEDLGDLDDLGDPGDLGGLGDLGDTGGLPGDPPPVPPAATAPVPAGASIPALPSWGGGGSAPLGSPLGPSLGGAADGWGGRGLDLSPEPDSDDPDLETAAEDEQPQEVAAEEPPGDEREVELPDGQRITAPTAELAAVIDAAIGGTPIPEAFGAQGITIGPPGAPVEAPVESTGLLAGDIGFLADRHALALGNGTAVLDGRIQPIADVTGPGFLGWQHPPDPNPMADRQERGDG